MIGGCWRGGDWQTGQTQRLKMKHFSSLLSLCERVSDQERRIMKCKARGRDVAGEGSDRESGSRGWKR